MASLLKKSGWIITLLLGLNLIAWISLYDIIRPRSLEVYFLNVGQGDAIFIQTPENQQVLIDGGPDGTVLAKLAKIMPFYDRSLDLVILTHPEHDHLFGLLKVLKRYKVQNILWTGVVRDTPEWKAWIEALQQEKAFVRVAHAGQRILFQDPKLCDSFAIKCVTMDILYPSGKDEDQKLTNSNDTSLVSRLQFGIDSFLFTGDITSKTEKTLISSSAFLEAKVLKVAHHGSKTSTSLEFLNAVRPRLAVIEVGKNLYGHPDPRILENLLKSAIEVLRTDRDGDIAIFSDGQRIRNSKPSL